MYRNRGHWNRIANPVAVTRRAKTCRATIREINGVGIMIGRAIYAAVLVSSIVMSMVIVVVTVVGSVAMMVVGVMVVACPPPHGRGVATNGPTVPQRSFHRENEATEPQSGRVESSRGTKHDA